MTTVAIRIYTSIIAVVCTAAIAFALHAQNASAKWRQQVAYWQQSSADTLQHDWRTTTQMRRLMHRYNKLVVQTRRSERRLLAALNDAQAHAPGTSGGTVYQTVSGPPSGTTGGSGGGLPSGGGATPTPAPTPQPPTTTTS